MFEMSKVQQSEIGNIDSYIQTCSVTMEQTEECFFEFMKLLKQIKSNPVLIFTDFFSKMDNPLYAIANFNSKVLDEAILPEIQKIEAFKDVVLKEAGYNTFTVQDKEDHALLNINLKDLYYRVEINHPKPLESIMEPNPHVIWLCQIVDGLNQFYDHPSIKNWRQFSRLDKTIYPRELYLIYFMKKGRRAKMFLERAKKEIKRNNENVEFAKSYAAKEAHIYEENKEKVEKIILFLRGIGYRDINDSVQNDT